MIPRYSVYITIMLEWRKSYKDCLCIREHHLCQFGEFVLILQNNRKPGNFSARVQYVQNCKRETLTWIVVLWVMGLVDKNKQPNKLGIL